MMEQSESGAPIYRHREATRDLQLAVGDDDSMEQISAHIEKFIGPVDGVFHELVSDLVHVDIHIVPPSQQRNCYTLVTSGMSDRPMAAPPDYAEFRYAELMICLPPSWPVGDENFKKEENYWPVRMLKFLARFPHQYETWLWLLHTIPNGNPAAPFAANTRMDGVILMPPMTVSPEFHELKISEEKTVHFHALIPLHPDEMELKLKKGAEALFDAFDKSGVTELLNPGRPSMLEGKRKKWWPFG